MIWEILGIFLSAIATGIFTLYKIKKDIYPYGLKKWLNRLALSNWQKSLPQKLQVYNFYSPKSTKDTGILSTYNESVLEKPQEIQQPGDADDLSFYGIDDDGNALVVKISKLWKGWTEVNLCLNINDKSYSVSYQGPASNPHEFSLGNFKLEMVEPFRVWRLWYNGSMEMNIGSENKDVDLVHVTLNFLWKPLENALDFQKNANLDLLSEYISENGSFGQNLGDLRKILPPGYFQFGSFHGDVKVDDVHLPQLYLYGHRLRRYLNPIVQINESGSSENSGYLGNIVNSDRMELFGMCGTNGNAFRLMSFNDDWVDGQVLYSSFQMESIRDVDVQAKSYLRNLSIPKVFTISDSKSTQTVEIWPKLYKLSCSSSLEIILLRLNINGKPGRGILIRKLDNISKQSILLLRKPGYYDLISEDNSILDVDDDKEEESNLDFLEFCSKSCRSISLVGGKGSSLAKLAILAKSHPSEFKTAKGFCVSTTLFQRMVNLQKLKNIFSSDELDLDQMCAEAINLIKTSGVETKLADLIKPSITKIFGSESHQMRFAVRSSGVLEDGADLSCAGQNETFLGVDTNSIPSKIIDCWASLFTPQSVGYRLNHGQPAVSEMGVVIQEMVNATSAGVLFTADPRTGNPFEMVLTANYGLGESVVSASCDPDTMILLRPRGNPNKLGKETIDSLKVGHKTLGDKKSKIILSSDGKSTEEFVTKEEESKRFCLNDDKALELGRIGTKIEKKLGHLKPVDIEWAVSEDGQIFILQCRAMTSLDAWTDFEIVHQFDSAIRTQIDLMTTANTGEVMPKPIFPISFTTASCLDIGTETGRCERTGENMCPVMARCTPIFGQRLHLNMYHILYSILDEETLTPQLGCIDLAVFGRSVFEEEMHRIAVERYGTASGWSKVLGLIHAFKVVRGSSKVIQEGDKMFGKLELEYDSIEQTPKAIHDKITEDFLLCLKIGRIHCKISEVSSTTLVFAFLTVTEGRAVKDWTSSLYEDAGTLLSAHSVVESAEMPEDIDELGTAIVKLGRNHQEFLNSTETSDAILWIRSHKDLGDALDKFLNKHGHRAIAEMDIGSKSWRTDPTPLINLLKNIVRNKLESQPNSEVPTKKQSKTVEQLLDALQTPLKSGSRRFLKFLLPHCRKAVINRERSKSLLVRTIDQLKHGYYRLAELMVKERLIPYEDFIKHLTHTEIGLLINQDPSTSTILYKAMRRMKLYPGLEKEEYEEISVGFPKPIDNSIPIEVTDVVKATPVSSGKVQGIAKVCLSVEEASELIRPGDILITRGTDIAWSPFFPLLGGVVTELGGLISHGAVVAREYGLPCIVGAVNATKIFKTGDEVILDTSTGTLAKVKHLENGQHSLSNGTL